MPTLSPTVPSLPTSRPVAVAANARSTVFRAVAASADDVIGWTAGGATRVEVRSHLPGLARALADRLPAGATAGRASAGVSGPTIRGEIRPFDSDRLLRRLPAGARKVGCDGSDLVDVYADPSGGPGGEGRFWTVDESWGLCEIDLPRGRWTAWVLPHAADGGVGSVDAAAVVDAAVVRPAAHLLAGRGTHLVPAGSVVIAGRGVLVVGPFGAVGGLVDRRPGAPTADRRAPRLLSAGWTAVREESGGVTLRGLPGSSGADGSAVVDPVAWCDAVVLVDPGRHGSAGLVPLSGESAVVACRSAWPMPGLTRHRRGGQFAARLARRCRVWRARLTDAPGDLPRLLQAVTAAAWPPVASVRPLREAA